VTKFVIVAIERITLERFVGTYTEDQSEVEVVMVVVAEYKQAHATDTASYSGSGSDASLHADFHPPPRLVPLHQLLPHQGLTVIIFLLFLVLTTVIKPIRTIIKALVAEFSLDKS
jgi:hypothetical protein